MDRERDEVINLRLLVGKIKKETTFRVKRKRVNINAKGSAKRFTCFTSRGQMSTIKCSYSKNKGSGSWGAHGRYLSRRSAQESRDKGLGFDSIDTTINITTKLSSWETAGDGWHFRIVISPERGSEVDLMEHTRKVMRQAELDFGTKLNWVGVVHSNTDNPHAHVVIRGVDDMGKPLWIDSSYIKTGFRSVSESLLTDQLGLRTKVDLFKARERSVREERFTSIDFALIAKASSDRIVSFEKIPPSGPLNEFATEQEKRRAEFLTTIGVASKLDSKRFILSPTMELDLKIKGLSKELKAIKTKGAKFRRERALANLIKKRQQMIRDLYSEAELSNEGRDI